MTTFESLFTEHVGASLGRQLALADLLGGRSWGLYLSTGRATFGGDLSFPVQLLGTEADGDRTWLWAWANVQSGLPPALVRASNELRELGERRGIALLTSRSFSTREVSGHQVAMVASGLRGNLPYYRGPYDGGALFFLLESAPASLRGPYETQRVVNVLMKAISDFPLDHRAMSRAFLQSQEFHVQEGDGSTWDAQAPDGRALRLRFDAHGRIAQASARLG
jgi:hypothetical protein